MAQAYTTIKNFIKTKLDGIAKLQEVSDDPKLKFSGYPAAVIVPTDQEADFETSIENERIYTFDVLLFHNIDNTGIGGALDAIYDLIDDVFDEFDKDQTFNGISLPAKYTMINVIPVSAGWELVADDKLIQANLKIQVRVTFDIT